MTDVQAMPVAEAAFEDTGGGIIDRENPPAWTLETPSYTPPADDPPASDVDTVLSTLEAMSPAKLHLVALVALSSKQERRALVSGVLGELRKRLDDGGVVDLTGEDD